MPNVEWKVPKGNLGADPEIEFFDDGGCMARLSIAVNRYQRDEDGEWEQKGLTTWINAVAFGYEAEQIEVMELEKGDTVFAEGIMYVKEYEDDEGYLVKDMNYYINRLFKIPKIFDDEEEEKEPRRRKKKKRKGKKRKGKKRGKKRGKKKKKGKSRLKKKRGKKRKKKGKGKVASKVLEQLKGG